MQTDKGNGHGGGQRQVGVVSEKGKNRTLTADLSGVVSEKGKIRTLSVL